uniref:Uncharacterized protein n=1 Tax=Oryza glaberrima TaxID=4538 RepID=I1QU27_ORYGL
MDGRMDQRAIIHGEKMEEVAKKENQMWRASYGGRFSAKRDHHHHGWWSQSSSFAATDGPDRSPLFCTCDTGDIGTRAVLELAGFSNSLFEKSKTESSSNEAKRCFRVFNGKLENVGYKSSGTKEADQKANQERGECRQGAER